MLAPICLCVPRLRKIPHRHAVVFVPDLGWVPPVSRGAGTRMGEQGKVEKLQYVSGRQALGSRVERSVVMSLLKRFADNEQGSTAVEYSIIAVLVSIIGAGALLVIGPAVMEMFNDAAAPF